MKQLRLTQSPYAIAPALSGSLWWRIGGLEGESPLRTLMVGTVSRTARVSVARRNLKEAVRKAVARRTGTALRQPHLGERAKRLKAQYHPEGEEVFAAGICSEGRASYPGRSVDLPGATNIVRCWDGLAEVSRGRSSCRKPQQRRAELVMSG